MEEEVGGSFAATGPQRQDQLGWTLLHYRPLPARLASQGIPTLLAERPPFRSRLGVQEDKWAIFPESVRALRFLGSGLCGSAALRDKRTCLGVGFDSTIMTTPAARYAIAAGHCATAL